MRLYSSIAQRSERAKVFCFTSGNVCAWEVLRHANTLRCLHYNLRGKRVLLRVIDLQLLPVYLIAFDGWAKAITILSDQLDEVSFTLLSERSRADYEVRVDEVRVDEVFSAEEMDSDITGLCDTKWIIPTSGTSSVPKLVEHSFESLTRAIKTDQEKGKSLVWGMLYDLTKFAGIQVLLQAVLGGSILAVPNGIDDKSIEKLFQSAAVNALSGTPTMWRKMLMESSLDGLSLKMITLGGEIADSPILMELEKRFQTAKITHVYASTEAGVGFAVSDGLAGFPAKWDGSSAPSGVEVKILDDRLFLRKVEPSVRYVGEPVAIADGEGWTDTGDVVKRQGERYIFLGRRNGTINVGGQKVQPCEVEHLLLSHGGVHQALVVAKSNPFVGNVVVAQVVVTDSDNSNIVSELLDLCRENLEPYKVPALIKAVTCIPMTAAGKIKRS